jgi:hypothetical protein
MLCVEDYIKALEWAQIIGGAEALQARACMNAAALNEWVEDRGWIENLAKDPATASNTSVCLKLTDSAVEGLSEEQAAAIPKRMVALLEEEGAGFEAGRALRASAGYRRTVRYDLTAGAVSREERSYSVRLDYDAAWGSLAAAWRREQRRDGAGAPLGGDERWTLAATRAGNEAELAWRRGWDAAGAPGYSELQLAYRPAAPGCAGGWTLAPSLGWDLLRGRVSRAGLELTLNDCCFAWTLAYQGVYLPQRPGKAAGHQLRFGVRLR